MTDKLTERDIVFYFFPLFTFLFQNPSIHLPALNSLPLHLLLYFLPFPLHHLPPPRLIASPCPAISRLHAPPFSSQCTKGLTFGRGNPLFFLRYCLSPSPLELFVILVYLQCIRKSEIKHRGTQELTQNTDILSHFWMHIVFHCLYLFTCSTVFARDKCLFFCFFFPYEASESNEIQKQFSHCQCLYTSLRKPFGAHF